MNEPRGIAATCGAFMARLNADRWTDDEIADVLGVTQVTVCLARQRLGLPPVVRGRDLERFRRTCQRRFEESLEHLNGHEPTDRP